MKKAASSRKRPRFTANDWRLLVAGQFAFAQQITEEPPAREMDMLLSTGEQVSTAVLAMALHGLMGVTIIAVLYLVVFRPWMD